MQNSSQNWLPILVPVPVDKNSVARKTCSDFPFRYWNRIHSFGRFLLCMHASIPVWIGFPLSNAGWPDLYTYDLFNFFYASHSMIFHHQFDWLCVAFAFNMDRWTWTPNRCRLASMWNSAWHNTVAVVQNSCNTTIMTHAQGQSEALQRLSENLLGTKSPINVDGLLVITY